VFTLGSFRTFEELWQAVYKFLLGFSTAQNARPFRWTHRPKSWDKTGTSALRSLELIARAHGARVRARLTSTIAYVIVICGRPRGRTSARFGAFRGNPRSPWRELR
jgi:hypothetical protein